MTTRIIEPHGTWYWEASTENKLYEWNPPGFPATQRQCFSWKWRTNLKQNCESCKLRVECLTVTSSKCMMILETQITLSEITGMVDEYRGFKRFPYEVKNGLDL